MEIESSNSRTHKSDHPLLPMDSMRVVISYSYRDFLLY